jgi:hypothetical protein
VRGVRADTADIPMKKYTIQLRHYGGQSHYTSDTFTKMGEIKLRLYAEQCGNFNPIFCSYKGAWYLVHSDEGDTSDPFRREESYAKTFFICVEQPCERKDVAGHSL